MLGQLMTAQAIANSIAEGRPTLSTLKQSEGGTGGVDGGEGGGVDVSLSGIAQQLLGGETDASGGGFQSLGDLLGPQFEQAYDGFVDGALGQFVGGVADLAAQVFDLPIEDALVAVREATADLRTQLDGRGDVQAQFVALVAGAAAENGATGVSAEANVDFRSVTISFDDDTNAFSLSIDDVSVSQSEAAVIQQVVGEDGETTPVAAFQQQTALTIQSF
ncbi:MAG: hypothetical protein AAF684_08035, partial [Pseudomonadota bacterium]